MSLVLSGTNGLSDVDGTAATPAIRGTDTNTGIFFPAADTIAFSEGGAEIARFDSSGNFGIGATPNAKLTVIASTGVQATFGAGNGSNYIMVGSGNSTNTYGTQFGYNVTGEYGLIQPYAATNVTDDLAICPSGGNLLVGTTSSALTGSQVGSESRFAVAGSAGRVQIADTGNDIAFSRNASNYISATAGTSASITVKAGSAAGGVQLTNGATSWASASDERTKTDLVEITDATAKVATLRAVTGRYKTDEEGVSRAFLIAQDVQAVLPEAVTVIQNADNDEDNGKFMLSYTETIPLLVAAIKEQQAIITQLQADVAALKGTA